MAFTGTALVEQVADGLVRITGVSLAEQADGVIILHPFVASPPGGAVRLPEGFKPAAYSRGTEQVSLQACVEASFEVAEDTGLISEPCVVFVKTGTSPADLVITLTNTAAVTTPGTHDSGDLEIYVRYH